MQEFKECLAACFVIFCLLGAAWIVLQPYFSLNNLSKLYSISNNLEVLESLRELKLISKSLSEISKNLATIETQLSKMNEGEDVQDKIGTCDSI